MMASNIGLPEVSVAQNSTPRPEVMRAAVSVGTTVTIAKLQTFLSMGEEGCEGLHHNTQGVVCSNSFM